MRAAATWARHDPGAPSRRSCDATGLPVLAAGGIADGRGVAAAFLLGASGVQLGTASSWRTSVRYIPFYKEKILKANDIATITTGGKAGSAIRVRSLKTPFSRHNTRPSTAASPTRRSRRWARPDAAPWPRSRGRRGAGGVLSRRPGGRLVRKRASQSAAEIIREIFGEAVRLAGRCGKMGKIAFLFPGQGRAVRRHGPGAL